MLTIGITGSYASGKTFLLQYFAKMGFKTFSADEYVKTLYQNFAIQKAVLNLLPEMKVFDKVTIAKLIYNNDHFRQTLQNFIHPLVIKAIEGFKRDNKQEKLIFAEIPLLFEANLTKYFDFTIVTFCSEKTRIERAMSRKNYQQEIYDKISKIQLPQNEKLNKADFIINTDVNIVKLESQVSALLKQLR